MSELRKKATKGLERGDVLTTTRTFTEQDTMVLGNITKDYNPVHYDDRFAQVKNLNARICHGLLVAGMITEIGGQIAWFASGMSFRFKKPVYFGDTITCTCTITELDEKQKATAKAVYTNQHGIVVLEASLHGYLPAPSEKQVLKQMIAEGDPTNKLLKKDHHKKHSLKANI
ncbi:MAG: MaoC/PaaZ C-terminal domain-containing protein [Deltaproteobacteria bacterium]|nr:MaoC/PaaZ C-terminal domain-containing protein [Deltaproteobacteria bacterium]